MPGTPTQRGRATVAEKPASTSSAVTQCQQGKKAVQVRAASGLGSQSPAFCLVCWFRLGFNLPLYHIGLGELYGERLYASLALSLCLLLRPLTAASALF